MFNSFFNQPPRPAADRRRYDTCIYHFVIDCSGSMAGSETFVEQGFNTQLAALRSLRREFPEREYKVSLTYFNSEADHRIFAGRPDALKPLRRGDYRPRGGTALLDALGSAVSKTRRLYDEGQRTGDVTAAVVVITDGEENSSVQYDARAVSRMVKDCEATGRWTFTFMGADFDAASFAEQVSLSREHCMRFDKTDFAESMDALSRNMHAYERRKSEGHIMKSLFHKEEINRREEAEETEGQTTGLTDGLRF